MARTHSERQTAISNVHTSGRCREQLDKGVGNGSTAEKVEMGQKEVHSDLDLSLSSSGVQLGACMGMWASGAKTASLFHAVHGRFKGSSRRRSPSSPVLKNKM